MSENPIIGEGTFRVGGQTYHYQERAKAPDLSASDPEKERAISEKLLWNIGVELKALTDEEWEKLKTIENERRESSNRTNGGR